MWWARCDKSPGGWWPAGAPPFRGSFNGRTPDFESGNRGSNPRPRVVTANTTTITGELIAHRIVGEDFWSIATVQSADGETVAAVGKLLGAQVGDSIRCDGVWNTHRKFGRQFKVTACEVTIPQTDNGVIAWLSSRLPNVGRTRARALLDHCGGPAELWRTIEHEPLALAAVHGITTERAEAIAESYRAFRDERDSVIRFRGWGMTQNQVARMLAVWGADSESNLRDNPYSLAEVVPGFGFLRADAIANRMGIPRDNTGRIECGLRHTMTQATGHGHCYVATGKLVKIAAEKVLRLDAAIVAKHLAIMRGRGEFVQHGARTFTRRLDRNEQRCADMIRALLEQRGDA